jgi:hypothetical protein
MIDRLRLLLLLNASTQQANDIADGLVSGYIFATSNGDQMAGIYMSPSGLRLLRAVPLLPDATA